jgi:hypothetical protein
VKEPNNNGTNGDGGADRGASGRFLPGHSIRTGGRPKGARTKLSEHFLTDLHSEWKRRGKKALEQVSPELLVKVMSQLLPRVLEVDANLAIEQRSEVAIAIADFRAAYKLIGARPRQPDLIERQIDSEDENGAE